MFAKIGIILNKDLSKEQNEIYIMYKSIYDAVRKNKGIPIGIIGYDEIKEVDGVILQGGDDYTEEDLNLVRYLYNNNIPTLGICLGMQKMGMSFNGKMGSVINHKNKSKYTHDVMINKDSLLYKIFKKEKISVNSRHKDTIISTDLDISGYAFDGTIEAIEDKNKKFFLGLQWHPESMITYDELENSLFSYFIEICRGEKNESK